MYLLKISGPQIQLYLFIFWSIVSKHLNGLTTIDTLSWLGGAVLTHPLWVQEVSGSIPCSDKRFYVWFFVLLLFLLLLLFYFLSKTHYLSQKFAIPFALLIYLAYLPYCKIYDQLLGYQDTDRASLRNLVLR